LIDEGEEADRSVSFANNVKVREFGGAKGGSTGKKPRRNMKGSINSQNNRSFGGVTSPGSRGLQTTAADTQFAQSQSNFTTSHFGHQ